MNTIRDEVRKIKVLGISTNQIRFELKQREIPETELVYMGAGSGCRKDKDDLLGNYSTQLLKKILEIMAEEQYLDGPNKPAKKRKEQDMRGTDAKIVTGVFDKVKENLTGNIYDEIKARLEACETVEEYKLAYKWLAGQFVEINESAKNFEEKFVTKYGKEELGILIYGSKEAYDKQVDLEKRLASAQSENERSAVLMEMVLTDQNEELDIPELWPEDEECYQQAL